MISILSPSSVQNFNMIKEIISTHPLLTVEDQKYGITYITHIIEDSKVDAEILSRFLLYANKNTYIGLFAHCYNDFFESAIKSKNEKIIKNMVLETKENVFFELFDNKYITVEDKDKVSTILRHELLAVKNTLLNITSNLSIPIFIGQNSQYSKEYQKIILEEYNVHVSGIYTPYIYVTDNPKNKKLGYLFIFNIWDLMLQISRENINPKTNEPFTLEIYDAIKKQYNIEIKLISRYLKTKK